MIDFFALIIFLLEVLINTCFYFCKPARNIGRPRNFINLFTDCADYLICDDSGDLQITMFKQLKEKKYIIKQEIKSQQPLKKPKHHTRALSSSLIHK